MTKKLVEAPDEAADSGMDLLWMADSVLRLLPLSGNCHCGHPLGLPWGDVVIWRKLGFSKMTARTSLLV